MSGLDERTGVHKQEYIDTLLDKDIKDLSALELRFLSENGYPISSEIIRRINDKLANAGSDVSMLQKLKSLQNNEDI